MWRSAVVVRTLVADSRWARGTVRTARKRSSSPQRLASTISSASSTSEAWLTGTRSTHCTKPASKPVLS